MLPGGIIELKPAHPQDTAAQTGLRLLREPIPDHLISPLPKPAKWQTDSDRATWVHCRVCGTKHHPQVVHLSYVGHAATTKLLLDADLMWDWAPLAFEESGLPKFDPTGGLWIKLTVCGKTRLGYGNADKKNNADAGAREKEVIGDALRNAAMRFGLALDLWSKADLHADDGHDDGQQHEGGGSTGAPPPPKVIDYYHADDFKKNLAAWAKLISGGIKTTEQIIFTVESKGRPMTQEQKLELASFVKTNTGSAQ
jgi:hypothetical protein